MAASITEGGLIVETVASTGSGARAGIEAGDLLENWYREANSPANPEPSSGRFANPFDLIQIETEQKPRGQLVLHGARNGQAFSFPVLPGVLGVTVRPVFEGEDLDIYLTAVSRAEAGDHEASAVDLEALAGRASRNGDEPASVWLLYRAVEGLDRAGTREFADRLREKAIAAAERIPDPSIHAWLLYFGAKNMWNHGRLDEAHKLHQRALLIRQQLADESLVVALSFHQLGNHAFFSGDPGTAEKMWHRGMVIRQREAPGSLALVDSFNNLAIIAMYSGDLERAEDLHLQCLAIRERLVPDSLDVAQSLTNLGIVADTRGDSASNEEYQRRALEIIEKLAPESLEVAISVFNLGGVALSRGDFTAAEHHFRRALEIRQRLRPESLDVAGVLDALARVESGRGNFEAAESFNRQALALRSQLAPGGLEVAGSLITQGVLALEMDRLNVAEDSLRQGCAILQDATPGGLQMGACWSNLGFAVYQKGDLKEAEALQRRALAIIQTVSPRGVDEAEVLYRLGLILRDNGKRALSLELMMKAIDGLEAQAERLGGSTERRAGFRERYMDIYREALHLQVEEGRPEQAFAILERSRAHGQLAMLAERDLMFSNDIPLELERRRRKVAAEADRVLAELGHLRAWGVGGQGDLIRGVDEVLGAEDADPRETLFAQLQELRREQEQVRALIRNTSPRLAALTYPQPLDLGETISMLDPGTVLLAYSVGEKASYLFVIEADTAFLEVFRLNADEARLRSQTKRFRAHVRAGENSRQRLDKLARELSRTLLVPASKSITRADRLVIVADGPLHVLPFAALADPLDVQSGRFLIERKPVTVVGSATVLAELKRSRRERNLERVVAFGDSLADVDQAGVDSRRVSWIDGALGPLPGSRTEVEALGRIFGEAATIWIGKDATEDRVKAVGPGPTILHMAVHGLVNEKLPMESGLVLAMPADPGGEDNGLLQVWEIFEQVRLDADLVILSACETALGLEVSGEGLLGLSQAFQYAGTRTVLASLWSIADKSTSELMQYLYHNLRAGMAKDQALRLAQIELIRAPLKSTEADPLIGEIDAQHPYYWAAFQLIGDWR